MRVLSLSRFCPTLDIYLFFFIALSHLLTLLCALLWLLLALSCTFLLTFTLSLSHSLAFSLSVSLYYLCQLTPNDTIWPHLVSVDTNECRLTITGVTSFRLILVDPGCCQFSPIDIFWLQLTPASGLLVGMLHYIFHPFNHPIVLDCLSKNSGITMDYFPIKPVWP